MRNLKKISSGDDAPTSLDLLDPNPGVIILYDDLWMVDIPGVDKDLDILQYLTLYDSLAAYNL